MHATEAPKLAKVSVATPYLLLETFMQRTGSAYCKEMDIDKAAVGSSRGLIDMLVFCKALLAAGYESKLELVPAYSYKRALRMVENGEADVVAETVWQRDANAEFFVLSQPIVRDGDFVKGVYTLPEHPLQKLPNAKDKLDQYFAVSMKNWLYDWQKIQQLTPLLTNSSSYRSIFLMLEAGRADFTLMEFGQSEDLSIKAQGVLLKPLDNIKVVIPGSRHFAISRKSVNAKVIVKNLNKGLSNLRASGLLKKSLIKNRYNNERVKDWTSI